MSSLLSLAAFQLGGGGRGPGPSGYAYGLMITVQVCPHINYNNIYRNRNTTAFNSKKITKSLKTKNIHKIKLKLGRYSKYGLLWRCKENKIYDCTNRQPQNKKNIKSNLSRSSTVTSMLQLNCNVLTMMQYVLCLRNDHNQSTVICRRIICVDEVQYFCDNSIITTRHRYIFSVNTMHEI